MQEKGCTVCELLLAQATLTTGERVDLDIDGLNVLAFVLGDEVPACVRLIADPASEGLLFARIALVLAKFPPVRKLLTARIALERGLFPCMRLKVLHQSPSVGEFHTALTTTERGLHFSRRWRTASRLVLASFASP